MNPPLCKTKRRINALSLAKLIVSMEGMTVYELAEITGLHYTTVRHYVHALHKEGGCHVSHWEPDGRGRHVTAAYSLGRKKDADKPRISSSQRAKMYRARIAQRDVLMALHA